MLVTRPYCNAVYIPWIAVGRYEARRPLAALDNSRRRYALYFDDARNLISLVLAGEYRSASQKLGNDTAQAPHVNREAVAGAEDDLRRPVEPRLDVRVDALLLVTARSKVDHLRHRTA